MTQVLPAVSLSNIHAALQRIYSWLDLAGKSNYMPSDDDLRIWQRVTEEQAKPNA